MLVPVTVALVVVQEMCARMGTVTGKGLADLIREHFGLRVTFVIMMAVLVTNFGNAVAEFAGVASSFELFGISRYVSVPLGAVFVWWLVVFGTYKSVEKAFLIACLVYLAYPFSGLMAQPDWKAAARGLGDPADAVRPGGRLDGGRHRRHHDRALDAVLPAVLGGREGVEGLRLRAGAARRDHRLDHGRGGRLLHRDRLRGHAAPRGRARGQPPAADAARALAPLAGRYASWLFAVGLANASLFAASILPLATAYSVCEGLGLEAGVDRSFGEAPEFYWLYTLLIVGSAGMILLPGAPLLRIILVSQIVNGILLPVILVFMLLLINREGLMGRFTNGRAYNVVAWATVRGADRRSRALLVVTSFLPGRRPRPAGVPSPRASLSATAGAPARYTAGDGSTLIGAHE